MKKCCACAVSSEISSTHAVTSAFSTAVGSSPGTRCTPSSTSDQPSCERALERRAHADEHLPRLLEEAGDERVVGVRHARARLEARVVDRRHELVREERAHRLADEVRRGDARDPEPVRDLRRDRRLAGAGRAADEDDDRQVELAQLLVAAQLPQRLAALDLAEHLDGELLEPVELDDVAAALGEVVADAARERVRAIRRDADGHQRAGHQAARVRQPVLAAERQRHDRGAARSCAQPPAARAASSARRAPGDDDLVVGEHDLRAARERMLGDDVDRRRLELDEVRVGVDASRARRASSVALARGCATRGRRRRRDARRRGAGREDGDAAAERLDAGAAASDETSVARRVGHRQTRSLIERAVRVQARRGRARRGCARDVAIGGIAAPLPSKTTTSGSSDAASRAPSSTFDANGAPAMPPPARRQPIVGTPASAAVSRWSDAACRPERESATRSSTRRRRLDQLRLRRPAPAHRDDDDAPVAREQPRDVAR